MQKDSAEKSAPAYPIASVDNALRLLLMLRDQQQVRLSDASTHLGVAHSTAHRLLAMLTYHDFVRQEPRRRTYVAGPALLDIGLAAVRKMDLRQHARPVLEELVATFGETAHLARLEGPNVRYLDAVETAKALRVTARTGTLLPANCTATGKVLLARLPADELTAIIPEDADLPASTTRSITSVRRLNVELGRVRERGYAVNIGESEDGIVSVAADITRSGSQVVGGLSVSGPQHRMPDASITEIGAQLRMLADDLATMISS